VAVHKEVYNTYRNVHYYQFKQKEIAGVIYAHHFNFQHRPTKIAAFVQSWD